MTLSVYSKHHYIIGEEFCTSTIQRSFKINVYLSWRIIFRIREVFRSSRFCYSWYLHVWILIFNKPHIPIELKKIKKWSAYIIWIKVYEWPDKQLYLRSQKTRQTLDRHGLVGPNEISYIRTDIFQFRTEITFTFFWFKASFCFFFFLYSKISKQYY